MENPSKSYNDRIEALFKRFPSVSSAGFTTGAYKPGLERMLRFAEVLGHPERQFRSVHVAGTNGKGSVSNMLASALSATGLSAGLFTSPHILDFRERARIIDGAVAGPLPLTRKSLPCLSVPSSPGPLPFTRPRAVTPVRGRGPTTADADNSTESALKGPLDGPLRSKMAENALKGPDGGPLGTVPDGVGTEETLRTVACMVPKEYVEQFLDRWEGWFGSEGLSFFEITTGLAFSWFADCGVDVGVIEAGLGGRLDSTNMITPDLAIITSIGLDHCAQLGSTLPEIAREKAGIMKPGVPCLIGDMNPETWPVFEEMAATVGCPLYCAETMEPPLWDRREEILAGMDLCGEYQSKNLRTVLSALGLLASVKSPAPPRGKSFPCLSVPSSPEPLPASWETSLPNDSPSGAQPRVAMPPGGAGLFTEEAVIDGICHTAARMGFRGRWEKLSENPTVICDIAHNPPALKENFGTLSRMLSDGEISSLTIVYGVMADKDTAAIFPLIPQNADLILTAPETPRAMPVDELLRRYLSFCASAGRDSSRVRTAPSVPEAVSLALASFPAPVQGAVSLTGVTARGFVNGRGPGLDGTGRGVCSPDGTERHGRDLPVRDTAPCTGQAPEAMVYIGGSTYVVAEAIPLFEKNGL